MYFPFQCEALHVQLLYKPLKVYFNSNFNESYNTFLLFSLEGPNLSRNDVKRLLYSYTEANCQSVGTFVIHYKY